MADLADGAQEYARQGSRDHDRTNELVEVCKAEGVCLKSLRALYLAETHFTAGRPAEAEALFARAVERAEQAKALWASPSCVNTIGKDAINKVRSLEVRLQFNVTLFYFFTINCLLQ